MIINNQKRCPNCKKWLAKENYYPSYSHSGDGLASYCKKCKCAREYQRKKRCYTSEQLRAEAKHNYKQLKLKILTHYSHGKTCCVRCGFVDIRALSIDHINGGGCKHLKQIGLGKLYHWLLKNKYPEGFQVLCMNCQFIKRHENNECIKILPIKQE